MTLRRQDSNLTTCNDYLHTLLPTPLEVHPDIPPQLENGKRVWQAQRNPTCLVLQMSTTALLALALKASSPHGNHSWKNVMVSTANNVQTSQLDHRHPHPIPRIGLGGCELMMMILITSGAFITDPRHLTLLEDLTRMRRTTMTHTENTPKPRISLQLQLHSPSKDPAVAQDQRQPREGSAVTAGEVLGSGERHLRLKR